MEFIYVLMDMPGTIRAHAVPNYDGSYTIFVNSRYNLEQQKEGVDHELRHIFNGDFDSDLSKDVNKMELRAHMA